MNYQTRYDNWKNDNFFDESTRNELLALADEKEIEDRFYKDLEFGTGGLRGIMGAGTNRMNKYTVGKVTKGLGDYLIDAYGSDVCRDRGVVIGYDTRNNSELFSRTTGEVLSGMGIRTFIHTQACPTPQLSFSIKYLDCLAGVMITASHNPKEYNGYKIYDKFGCQLVPWQVEKVTTFVDAVSDYHAINFAGDDTLISRVDLTSDFVNAVLEQSRLKDRSIKEKLRVVYTPLHGTGKVPVLKTLQMAGFKNVDFVPLQIIGNGDFPTVTSPNPEDWRALEMGIEQAEITDADIVLGTDPDCDRVGIAVKTCSGYQLMTGNQVGALLMDYVLERTDLKSIKNPAVVKTIVTSELGAYIAKKRGVSVFSTLTGFKFIGEKITQFEKGDERKNYTFVLGYEESYGYLVGTHARDKDAVVSSLLICEMAAEYKTVGKTLLDRMNEIYKEFGYYGDALDSFTFERKCGTEKIETMMDELRLNGSPIPNTVKSIDYKMLVEAEPGFGMLPTSNVLRYDLSDGSWIAVRPSGTEPKIKIYYSVKGASKEDAEKKLEIIQTRMRSALQLK